MSPSTTCFIQPKDATFFWGTRFAWVLAPRVSCQFQGTATSVLNSFPSIVGRTLNSGNPVAHWIADDGDGGTANCVDQGGGRTVTSNGCLDGEIADPQVLSNGGVVPVRPSDTNFSALAKKGGGRDPIQ
jgi:hypothetical protein